MVLYEGKIEWQVYRDCLGPCAYSLLDSTWILQKENKDLITNTELILPQK